MKRVLLPILPKPDAPTPIPEDEAHHLIQVLRVRNGETIEALDGAGAKMLVQVDLLGKGKAQVIASGETLRDPSLMSLPVILEMAVLKGEAMEWTVEKAVELGIRTFIPVISAHAVVQVDRKGPEHYRERWQKIADQALKQCGRLDRMIVRDPIRLEIVLQEKRGIRFWADENERAQGLNLSQKLSQPRSSDEAAILIGPEGGWSTTERELIARNGSTPISLGPWVLRAETAALFATSLVTASMR